MRLSTLLIAFSVFVSFTLNAQAPQRISYQAVVRDNSNALIVNTTVGVKISILKDSESGTPVYVETHKPKSNENGLITLAVGGGTVVSGTFFIINWSSGVYFIKTEIDPNGGSNYTISGSSQLLSVPYALYSANGGTAGPKGDKGDKGDIGLTGLKGDKGDKGDKGLQGDKGVKGDTGQGTKGDKGDKGDAGIQGPKGEKGDPGDGTGVPGPKGDKGDKGDIGLSGSKGDTGAQGIQGLKGDKGDKGDGTGVPGPKGDKGDKGDIGLSGSKGDTGAQGIQGIQGLKGDKGDIGLSGSKGDTGAQGIQGIQGLKGDKGDPGDGTGVPGPKGDKGDKGDIGLSGSKGDTGAQGIQGIQGLKGDKGDIGLSGSKGDKGDKGDPGDGGGSSNTWSILGNSGTTNSNFLGTTDNNPLIFKVNKTERLRITTDGKVVVGDPANINLSGNYKLYVESGILTERLKVAVKNSSQWADYVFAHDYELKSLEEVESFIKENKHLPNIPSASELQQSGLDVMEMQSKQMEKIEELTLYIIDINKKIEQVMKENKALKAVINKK